MARWPIRFVISTTGLTWVRQDRCLGLSSFSFDLSVYDVFGMLAAGGTLVMLESQLVREASHWVDLLVRHDVTIWNSVPALMEMLHTYALNRPTNSLGSLRLTMLSGDWIPVSLPERIRRLAPRNQLVSLGGATEASIWSIAYEINRSLQSGRVFPTANHWRARLFTF